MLNSATTQGISVGQLTGTGGKTWSNCSESLISLNLQACESLLLPCKFNKSCFELLTTDHKFTCAQSLLQVRLLSGELRFLPFFQNGLCIKKDILLYAVTTHVCTINTALYKSLLIIDNNLGTCFHLGDHQIIGIYIDISFPSTQQSYNH
jgi:hypothetical protein